MPCLGGGPSQEQVDQEKHDNDTATRLACAQCRALEVHGVIPDWAQDWWQRHKRVDEQRTSADAKFRQEQDLRAIALAKLTTAERAVLGV